MGYDSGDLKTMNSSKEIDLNTTLPAMIDFRNALRQAKTGLLNTDIEQQTKLSDNDRKLNQIRGLSLLISAQETLITLGRSQINYRSYQKYLKENKDKKPEEMPDFYEKNKEFSQLQYDINRINYWNDFLQVCRRAILNAEQTKSTDDDFMVITDNEGDISYRLTDNFWDMLEDLQKSYSEIHLLLMVNKVIAAGIEQDEELSYRETEKLFIDRVRDA